MAISDKRGAAFKTAGAQGKGHVILIGVLVVIIAVIAMFGILIKHFRSESPSSQAFLEDEMERQPPTTTSRDDPAYPPSAARVQATVDGSASGLEEDLARIKDVAPTDKMTTQPGDIWINPRTGKRMVRIESGFITPLKRSRYPLDGTGGINLTMKDGTRKEATRFVPLPGSPVYITGFFMDETRVSNEEYHRFMMETGAKAPEKWEAETPPKGEEAAPVAVNYEQARSYAKWAGLRLPALYEFCAAIAGKEGTFPWEDDLIEKIGDGSDKKEDISPRGIRDGSVSGWLQWGLDSAQDGWQLAFWLTQLSDGTQQSHRVNPNDAHIANTVNFRCVDDSIGILGFIRKPVEYTEIDTVLCSVTITNTLSVPVEVWISNGVRVNVPASDAHKVKLPIGTYLVTFRALDPAVKESRIMRAVLHQHPTKHNWPYVGNDYEWRLTETTGEPFPVEDTQSGKTAPEEGM